MELLARPIYHDQRVWLDCSILSGGRKITKLEITIFTHLKASSFSLRISPAIFPSFPNQDSTFFQFLVTETQLRITNDLITCFMYEQNIPHD
jgi:hypothetical protein